MSPLIATVLLMAFAVALGGMIMNLGGTNPVKSVLDCTAVSLDIIQFCHDDQAINIHTRNTGDKTIDELTLKIVNPGGQFSITLQGSQVRKGQTLTKQVPFLVTNDTAVSLLASLSNNGQPPELCPTPYITKQPLPKC
jgi:hypothetical protein